MGFLVGNRGRTFLSFSNLTYCIFLWVFLSSWDVVGGWGLDSGNACCQVCTFFVYPCVYPYSVCRIPCLYFDVFTDVCLCQRGTDLFGSFDRGKVTYNSVACLK